MYTKLRFGDPGSDRARADFLQLQGRRLVYLSEPPGPFNDELLKNHSGDDPISARALFSNKMIVWRPTHTIIFSTNSSPAVTDIGYAMRRRLRAVPFSRSFEDRIDDTLEDRMKAEAPGILRWLVQYAQKYEADHSLLDLSRAPQAVLDRSDQYIKENDPLAGFFTDTCVREQGARVEAGAIYDAYRAWMVSNDRENEPMTKVGFGMAMTARHVQRKRTMSQWYYVGFKLKED